MSKDPITGIVADVSFPMPHTDGLFRLKIGDHTYLCLGDKGVWVVNPGGLQVPWEALAGWLARRQVMGVPVRASLDPVGAEYGRVLGGDFTEVSP